MNDDLSKLDHVDLLFPSKYLKAADLQGRRVRVEIEHIAPREQLRTNGGKTEPRVVITLKGKEKLFVCNKTNANSIAAVYGKHPSAWIGKPVVLYPTRARFGPQEVDAIRVDEVATRQAMAQKQPAPAAVAEPEPEPETDEGDDT